MSKYFQRYNFNPSGVELRTQAGLEECYRFYVKLGVRRKARLLLPCDFFIHLSTYYDPSETDSKQQFLADFLEDVTNPVVTDFVPDYNLAEDDLALFQELFGEQAFNPNLMGKLASASPVRRKPADLQDVRTLMKTRWLEQRNQQLKFLKDVLVEELPEVKLYHDTREAWVILTGPPETNYFLRKFDKSELFQHKKEDVFNCIIFKNFYVDISHQRDIRLAQELREHLGDRVLEGVHAVVPVATSIDEYIAASKPLVEYLN